MKDLRPTLRPATPPTFDYNAIADAEVVQQLRETADKIRGLQDAASIGIGRALLSVKDKLKHGQFLEWIEAEFVFGRRTAVRMMQVATAFGNKWDTVSHLPTTVLYKLAAPSTPPAVREAVLNLKPGEVVTPQGVQSAINAVRKAEQPKKSSLKKEEREAQRASENERQQARLDKESQELQEKKEAARDAAEHVRFMLGGYFPELCGLLETVDTGAFAEALKQLAQEYRDRLKAEGER